MMEQKEKVRFRSFSIKEEKGRTTLLARKRVVKSQLTMFLIPLWSDVLARAIQNTKYKIQYKNTDVLERAIQAAVKAPDCGLIMQKNASSHKMHPMSDHRELASERGDKLPSLDENRTLLVISVEMFVDASLALLCSSAPSQY